MTHLTIEGLLQENSQLKQQLAKLQTPVFDDRLKQLLEVMPAGVIVINSLGVINLCNPAAEQLLTEGLVGKSWRDIISDCFAPQADDGHEVSLKDGQRLSISTRALLDNQGQLVLLTNLTETRNLQGRLSHFQRLSEMGKMMASLAHQIRTPLSAALLYTSHLTRVELPVESRIKFAIKAKTRLLNIEQQISDMLVFARGETPLNDTVNLIDLFRSIEDSLDVPLNQYDADCEFYTHSIDVNIKCNQDVLVGAILNVVINSLQACKKNPRIKIVAQQLAQWLVISIIDNGPGMSALELQQALTPFHTTKSHGTGLGLSVAAVVAKAHNGRFEMASEEGEGSVAGFWLPIL